MQKIKDFYKNHKILGGFINIFLFIFIISIFISTSNDSSKKIEEKKVVALETATSTDTKVKLITSDTMIGTNIEFTKFEILPNTDTDRKGTNYAQVTIQIKDFYSKEKLFKNIGKLSAKIYQETFKNEPNITDVVIIYTGELTDDYGNKKVSNMISQTMNKTTHEKLNYKNFDAEKMCDFLREQNTRLKAETYCGVFATNLR